MEKASLCVTAVHRLLRLIVESGGVPPDWMVLMAKRHQNKITGLIQDPFSSRDPQQCREKEGRTLDTTFSRWVDVLQ
ncbi:unnamed protein product [Arabis nemorensis]|uniref:Uncharacterized protein n=1 Tax=Arabis nemorensis TaxID=586526 RepID=A0A565BU66_9BRAS|nr:unnamed protein product [Arabis nemorensis]